MPCVEERGLGFGGRLKIITIHLLRTRHGRGTVLPVLRAPWPGGSHWLGHHALHQKVVGLIPGQGTDLDGVFDFQLGCVWQATD